MAARANGSLSVSTGLVPVLPALPRINLLYCTKHMFRVQYEIELMTGRMFTPNKTQIFKLAWMPYGPTFCKVKDSVFLKASGRSCCLY